MEKIRPCSFPDGLSEHYLRIVITLPRVPTAVLGKSGSAESAIQIWARYNVLNAEDAAGGSARRLLIDHYRKPQAGILIGLPTYLRLAKSAR